MIKILNKKDLSLKTLSTFANLKRNFEVFVTSNTRNLKPWEAGINSC